MIELMSLEPIADPSDQPDAPHSNGVARIGDCTFCFVAGVDGWLTLPIGTYLTSDGYYALVDLGRDAKVAGPRQTINNH
jgi:hypothetical protein